MNQSTEQNHRNVSKPDSHAAPGIFPPQRILVPIDFSDHSKRALAYAASLAKSFHSELVLIYVVESTMYPTDLGFGQVTPPEIEKDLRERGLEGLKKLLSSEVLGGVKSRAIVRAGNPYLEILFSATEEEVDLIIIASHGHTGVEHMLFGSTAEKIVRKAPCPVLVVRG